jgi:hypothetical protein
LNNGQFWRTRVAAPQLPSPARVEAFPHPYWPVRLLYVAFLVPPPKQIQDIEAFEAFFADAYITSLSFLKYSEFLLS